MKKIILFVLSLMLITTCIAQNFKVDGYYNDGYYKYFAIKNSLKLKEQGKIVPRQKLHEQRQAKSCSIVYNKKINKKISKDIYNQCMNRIVHINSLYLPGPGHKPANCHSTGFFINDEGVCVSNAHIFNKLNDDKINILANTVTDCEGNTYPVEKILATDVDNDVCIFKVALDKNTKSLPMKPESNVGDKTYIISNAGDNLYMLTDGILTRKYMKALSRTKGVKRISTNAEFCKGSSGAPLLDNKGNVIGVVSATLHIMSPDNTHQQMIVKECIPIQKVLDMIN